MRKSLTMSIMGLLSVCLIGLLSRDVFSSPLGMVVTLTSSLLSASVLGDASCDATGASGEDVCTPEASNDDVADTTKDSVGDSNLPIWWNYDIDQLFEDYFDCGSIIYGYEYAADDDDDDDDVVDDSNDGGNGNIKKIQQTNAAKENSEVLSDAQLWKLRHQWAVMREKYVTEVNLVPIEIHKVEGDANADSYSGPDEEMKISNYGVSAIVVPCRIGDAGPHKGRGVYATEPIKEGELVVSLDNGSTGIFKVGHSWREFAVSLPRETACNFIEWSWVQTISPRDEHDNDIRNGLTILISFDESNLMNAADWDGVEANISCGTAPRSEGEERGPCRFHYYAARDIAAGEELLVNYGEFEDLSQQGWDDIGL